MLHALFFLRHPCLHFSLLSGVLSISSPQAAKQPQCVLIRGKRNVRFITTDLTTGNKTVHKFSKNLHKLSVVKNEKSDGIPPKNIRENQLHGK